jgi:magnesium-transporting ATPase (P-type)
VLAVTALKDAIEDFNRHRADDTENNRTTHVVSKAEVHHARPIPWRELRVGDVVLIKVRRGGEGMDGGGGVCGFFLDASGWLRGWL